MIHSDLPKGFKKELFKKYVTYIEKIGWQTKEEAVSAKK